MTWRIMLVAAMAIVTSPLSQADELPDRISIATWNLEWFFDSYTGDNQFDVPKKQSSPSRDEWEWRLNVTAEAIAKLDATILCLQEVESRATVAKLVKRLREQHKLDYRLAFVEGADFFTEQDVCVLAKSGLVAYGRREQTKEMFKSKEYYNLQKHLFCEFQWGVGEKQVRLTLLNLHMRAQPERTDIRTRQARLAQRWLAEQIAAGENVAIVGDTNTEFPLDATTAQTDTGVLRGMETETTADDLYDCHDKLAAEDRPTHIIGKSFDRILVSEAMRVDDPAKTGLIFKSIANRKDLNTRGKVQDKDHWNIYYDIPQDERDISDHFPIIAEFQVK